MVGCSFIDRDLGAISVKPYRQLATDDEPRFLVGSANELSGKCFHLLDGIATFGNVFAEEHAGYRTKDQMRLDWCGKVVEPVTSSLLLVLLIQPVASGLIDAKGGNQLWIQANMDLAAFLKPIDLVAALCDVRVAAAASNIRKAETEIDSALLEESG